MIKLITAIIFCFFYFKSFSQIYLMPKTGKETITCSSGTLVDSGGEIGAYSDYERGELTIMPTSEGGRILLDFTLFDKSNPYDRLTIYDGLTTSARVIGTYYSCPGFVLANSSSGALTLKFNSNYALQIGNYGNFKAAITEIKTLFTPDLLISSSKVNNEYAFPGVNSLFSADVFNLNDQNLNSATVKLYLSKDTLIDVNDNIVKSVALLNVKKR